MVSSNPRVVITPCSESGAISQGVWIGQKANSFSSVRIKMRWQNWRYKVIESIEEFICQILVSGGTIGPEE